MGSPLKCPGGTCEGVYVLEPALTHRNDGKQIYIPIIDLHVIHIFTLSLPILNS